MGIHESRKSGQAGNENGYAGNNVRTQFRDKPTVRIQISLGTQFRDGNSDMGHDIGTEPAALALALRPLPLLQVALWAKGLVGHALALSCSLHCVCLATFPAGCPHTPVPALHCKKRGVIITPGCQFLWCY